MPNTGGGTGTPISPGFIGTGFSSSFRRPVTYMKIEDYARELGLAESAIYGLATDDDPDYGCNDYLWNERQRYQMLRAIAQAEASLEIYLHHPLRRTYICREYYPYKGCDLKLRKNRVLAIGDKQEDLVATGVSTGTQTFADEYLVTTPVTFTDPKEVVVYYPGQTRWEITPSRAEISNGTLTLYFPRARLLAPPYLKDYRDQGSHPNYIDNTLFLTQIDIYRRHPVTNTAVTFVWRRQRCGCSCQNNIICGHITNPGDILTQTGVGVIVDGRNGFVKVEPANLDSITGLWTQTTWTENRPPDGMYISYVSGIDTDCEGHIPDDVDPELGRAIIAMAHSNLPTGICKCGPANEYYESDAMVPKPEQGVTVLTPFGISRGQNMAWAIVKRHAVGVGGLL